MKNAVGSQVLFRSIRSDENDFLFCDLTNCVCYFLFSSFRDVFISKLFGEIKKKKTKLGRKSCFSLVDVDSRKSTSNQYENDLVDLCPENRYFSFVRIEENENEN